MRHFKSYSLLLGAFFHHARWKREKKNILYITFDDGPHPEITIEVLNLLRKFNAKTTFFCVGENIIKYPDVFEKILNEGHSVGNHTYDHKNGWKNSIEEYVQNVEENQSIYPFTLFRPPYGKIRPRQILKLPSTLKLVLWTVLSYDFDQQLTPEKCLEMAIKNTKDGTIIVFHDSEKAKKNLLYVLPRYLEYFAKSGYEFRALKTGD